MTTNPYTHNDKQTLNKIEVCFGDLCHLFREHNKDDWAKQLNKSFTTICNRVKKIRGAGE